MAVPPDGPAAAAYAGMHMRPSTRWFGIGIDESEEDDDPSDMLAELPPTAAMKQPKPAPQEPSPDDESFVYPDKVSWPPTTP